MSPGDAHRTAFLTGGTGFVGSNLARELLAAGWRVLALQRPGSPPGKLQGLAVEAVSGDITDAASLRAAIPESVDAVFHVAGSINVWSRGNAEQTRVNVGGTANMVDAALARGARAFIHTSTVSAYGRHAQPITEATVSNAGQSWINYERTKWLAEEEVRRGARLGLRAVIINPCAIFGPGDTHGWAQFFFLLRDGKVKGIPPGRLTFNDVGEVARAHLAAVDRGRAGANYILSGYETSFEEMLRSMADMLGVELRAKVMPAPLLRLIGRINSLVAAVTGRPPEISHEMATMVSLPVICGSDSAERELGYRKVPLRQCLGDSLAWLRAQKLI
ncbi:MAG: SDR family oxidoreductase [Gammaproteobacteria bacterium]|nr:SDR family oxidoreductase [Gammaproteobacteria bacterium]